MRKQLIALSLLAAIGFAGPSQAVDGVLEISQACSVFGCVPGDTGGFPITITQAGSYRLTSNLTTTDVNTTLIKVNADNVSIDLNGFSLTGPVSCSSTACSGSGTGIGIDAVGRDSVIIRNGTVRGMGADGILATNNALLEDLVVTSNGRNGIQFFFLDLVNDIGNSLGRRLVLSLNNNDGVTSNSFLPSNYIMDSTAILNGGNAMNVVFCSNSMMYGNTNCNAIAKNFCSPATQCD